MDAKGNARVPRSSGHGHGVRETHGGGHILVYRDAEYRYASPILGSLSDGGVMRGSHLEQHPLWAWGKPDFLPEDRVIG